MEQKFIDYIKTGYSFKGDSIFIGSAIYNNKVLSEAKVNIPLKTLNRHGLIAGATGTGKTVTLQIISEQISKKGIPILMMDLKGDLSGIAAKGISNAKIEERCKQLHISFEPNASQIEFLSLSSEKGARLRATVSEFGPVLFSKILGLNDTQSGVVSLIFKYCDDNGLALLDIKDFKRILQYTQNEGKEEIEKIYGKTSSNSVSTILRKIIELEQQGADLFFGETSFEVNDLCRFDENGNGIISIVRLTDIQDKPKMFSTFMLCLLAEIYNNFPETGDTEKPKLVIFIDEAHLVFEEASKALLDQIESIIKLIRSKGVGIFFCTQNPSDVPDSVLSQLGLKVQHALRAFTAKDRKTIKQTSENYPLSDFYKTDVLLTSLGIGEALITVLNEKGAPTPLAATHLRPPVSRMGVLSNEEIDSIISKSTLIKKYNQQIDRYSAYEMLNEKIEASTKNNEKNIKSKKVEKGKNEEPNILQTLSKNTLVRQVGRTIFREVTRGLLGVLGFGGSSSRGRRK